MSKFTITVVVAAAIAAALSISQLNAGAQSNRYDEDRAAAAQSGLTLGPVPDDLTLDALPDLIPVGDGDEILGYAFSRDVFADVIDPNLGVIAYGVYEPDGRTLLGHVTADGGFFSDTQPIATTAPAVVPDDY